MAVRRTGKRVCSTAVRRRKKRGPVRHSGGRREEAAGGRERWRLTQLVVSGGLFVLLVALTWFLPGGTAQLNETLSDAISRNMDVQAVFSAVGKAFSGQESVGGELYRAVFQPAAEPVGQEQPAENVEMDEASAWEILRGYRGEQPEGQAEPVSAAGGETAVETLAYVLYSQQNLPDNVSLEQALLGFDYCMPVQGTLSSGFGYRAHPTEGDDRFHYGVDLAADSGAEVCSFADGTVSVVGESSSYGKYCIVSHASGYRTLYAHCRRITAVAGAAVRRGQAIAEVGETGMATGPHLHFELQREGTYLNPIYYVAQT